MQQLRMSVTTEMRMQESTAGSHAVWQRLPYLVKYAHSENGQGCVKQVVKTDEERIIQRLQRQMANTRCSNV